MRLGVISDIHSDLPSLEKAIREIRKSGCEQILCLGDIVGYGYHYSEHLDGRDPNACIELVRESCRDVICGNHDLHAIRKLPSNHLEIGMPSDWYELDLGERYRRYGNRFWLYDDELENPLKEESMAYLESLPETRFISAGKIKILATHFIWPDITGSRQGSPDSLKEFRGHFRLLKKHRALVGLAGHAHLEGYARISKKNYSMNYFREASLIRHPQLIIVPAITRGASRNGYLILDTEKNIFEAKTLE